MTTIEGGDWSGREKKKWWGFLYPLASIIAGLALMILLFYLMNYAVIPGGQ